MSASQSCCCSQPDWADGSIETPAGAIVKIKTVLSSKDKTGMVRCRLSDTFRSKHRIDPGLYAVGAPTPDSPVLVTANYKLSFDELRHHLSSVSAWILVLDTKGINVWCAAGKGIFGTAEIVNRINLVRLNQVVAHKTVILPQLGAPGIKAHEVAKSSGFHVKFGPVRAADLPSYLQNKYTATPLMRRMNFAFFDRLALVPMEFFPALKKGFLISIVLMALAGLTINGIMFDSALTLGAPLLLALLTAIVTGSVLHPLLLPLFPVRAFTVQGLLLGLITSIPFLINPGLDSYAKIAIGAAIPAISSYLAFNFTGCTTFTNKSGVKKELTRILPVYVILGLIMAVALVMYKLKAEGVIQ